MSDQFQDPDYIAIEEIHAVLHSEGITYRQMIDRIQNVIAAWAMTGEEV